MEALQISYEKASQGFFIHIKLLIKTQLTEEENE